MYPGLLAAGLPVLYQQQLVLLLCQLNFQQFLYNRAINRNRLTLETLPVLKQYYQNLSIVDPARITAALNHIAVFLYEDHHDLTIRYMTEDWNEQYSGWNYVPDPEHAFSIHVT